MVSPQPVRTQGQKHTVSRLIWGLISGLLAAALALVTGSLLVLLVGTVGSLELTSGSVIHIFHYLSMGLGAFWGARCIGRMGWISGAIIAMTYFALLTWWIEGSWVFLSLENVTWLRQLAVAAGIGMVGGIIGVNVAA